MKIGKHLDGPALEALAAGASMPEAKFHVVECDACRAKLAAMRWENALFAGELREAGEHRAATVAAQPAPLPPAPLRAQTTWLGSTFSGGFAVPSAVAAVLVLGSAVALAAFLFGNRGGDETAGVKDEPAAAPEALQVGGDGDEKKKAKAAEDGRDAARTITWKGKTAPEWLAVWTDAQKPAGDEEAGKGRIHESREALTKLGADAIPALVEAIGKDTEFKESLCEILAAIQPRDEEVPAFLALLKHDHYAVRGSAVMALRSKVGDPRVEAALREAAKDSDRAVAEAANEVLAQVLARQDEKRQAATEFLLMANEAEAAAKYAEAVKAYSKCLDVDPNLEQAKAGLARCRKAMQDAVRAATAAEAIETTVVPREQRRAEAEKTGVKPEEPPVPTPVPITTVAPDGNLLVFPQTFASQASKDAAVAQAKAALREAEVRVNLAKRKADRFKNEEDLKKGVFTQDQREEALADFEIAGARWEAARARIEDLENRPTANDAKTKSDDETERLRVEVEKLKQIVMQQQQAADAAREEQARMRQGPPQGTVLAIKAEEGLVMVSMGKEQGVQAGQVFGVLRDGMPIARLKIEKVYPDMSSAKVLPDSLAPGQTVQVRDEVKLPPPHPRHDTAGDEGLGMPPMLERGVPGVEGQKGRDGQQGREGQQPRVNRPKRHDNADEEGVGTRKAPRGENPQGNDGEQPPPPPPPDGRFKRHDNAGEEGIRTPPPQGMQGGHPKFPPPPPPQHGDQGDRGGQGEGNRPPPPHGMMPPDAPKDGKGEKDRNDADEGLEF